MLVTVAICTWNRAELLDQTLQHMHQLRVPEGVEWELLVVNNNCTDHTDEVIARHADVLPIRRLVEPTPGHSHARNLVLDEAQGELIQWTDDDVLVDEAWLTELIAAAQRHPDAAGFGGPIEPWFPVAPDPDLVSAFPTLGQGFCGLDLDIPEGTLPDAVQVIGANMAHRVSKIGRLRYDTNLGMAPVGHCKSSPAIGGGEEFDLNNRLRAEGLRVVWVPTMRVKHYVEPARMTLAYLSQLYGNAGQTAVRLGGIPEGAKLFGVPRWLVREWVNAAVRSLLGRCHADRVTTLTWIRQRSYLGGIIRESYSRHRALGRQLVP